MLALGVPRDALWLIMGLVVVLSVILAEVTALIAMATVADTMDITGASVQSDRWPGGLQLIILLVMVVCGTSHRAGHGRDRQFRRNRCC